MTEYVNGWLTDLSKYIADLNTELVEIKAENAKLLRELDLTKRMYAKVSDEKCVTDAENAKLRELLVGMANLSQSIECEARTAFGKHYELSGRNQGLEAENARLRELVRTLVYCYRDDNDYAVGCDGCAMNGADMHVTIDRTFACDGLQHELKSLGIEVSDV